MFEAKAARAALKDEVYFSELGRVDKSDSQGALIVIQTGICDADQLGTRFDVKRRMGFSRELHSGRPNAERAQTCRPSARSRWDFLDSSDRLAAA